MCPGCTRSPGLASAATAARTVRARSAAEMPVVTPSAASIDTVKLVPVPERLAAPMPRHEVDRVGCHEIRRDDDIAFVFAIFLVDQHDHAAGLQFADDFRNG